LIESGSYHVLVYPSGEIVFRDGKVTSVALLTPEQTAIKQEHWRRREAEWKRHQAAEAERARAARATAAAQRARPAAGPAPSSPGSAKSEKPKMTKAEKRETEIEELKAKIVAAEQAEKDLSNVSYSVRRRRELRVELEAKEEEYNSMPEKTDEEQATKEGTATHIAALKAEIRDLGSKANRIRRRRETRAKLAELREKLSEMEK